MKLLKVITVILVIIVVGFLIIQVIPAGKIKGENPFRKKDKTLVISHRGGMNLWPENTFLAFDSSLRAGVDMLELDVVLTKDSMLAVLHDDTIDRVCEGKGKVKDFLMSELKGFNFGYQFQDPSGQYPYRDTLIEIPSLQEVLSRYEDIPKSIEFKDQGVRGRIAARRLKTLLNRYRDTDIIISSFDDESIKYFREITGNSIPTSYSSREAGQLAFLSNIWLSRLAGTHGYALHLPLEWGGFRLDDIRIINKAHDRNMAVHYWTINDSVTMERLISLGADGIMTDDPALLTRILLRTTP